MELFVLLNFYSNPRQPFIAVAVHVVFIYDFSYFDENVSDLAILGFSFEGTVRLVVKGHRREVKTLAA